MPQIPDEHLKILQDKFSHLFEIDRQQGVITLKKGFKGKRTGKQIPQFQMVYIPNGEFMMGSEKFDDEKPVHKVKISRPFFMGKFPVVQELYEAVMGKNPSDFKGKLRPVEKVNWFEAVDFCIALNLCLGLSNPFNGKGEDIEADLYIPGFRVPTIIEWEYAALAGEDYSYAGSNDIELVAWYAGNSSETKPVGLKMPNAWGLYDMKGNVWEWCLDWHHKRISINHDRKQSTKVYKGGSWYDGKIKLKSNYSDFYFIQSNSNSVGLRIVIPLINL